MADDSPTSEEAPARGYDDRPCCAGAFGHCDAEPTEHCSHCDGGYCFEHSKVIAGLVFCEECIVGGWADDLLRSMPLGNAREREDGKR